MCYICTACYQEISDDWWLLHPVEGTLRGGAGLEIKYGFHYFPTAV